MAQFSVIAAATLLLVAAFGLAWRSARRWPWRTSLAALAFRCAALSIVGLLLFYPSLTTESDVFEKPVILVLSDKSASMNLPSALGDFPRRVRVDTLAKKIRRRYSPKFTVLSMAFAASVGPAPTSTSIDEWLSEGSDLSAALRSLVSRSDSSRIRAAFLLSDGRATRGGPPWVWCRRSSFPVHVVQVGKEKFDYHDIFIRDLAAPSTAFRDEEITFRVSIGYHGDKESLSRRTAVVLFEDGREVRREVFVPGVDTTVNLVHKPLKSGFVSYSVRVGALPGELTELNNETSTAVMVEDEPRGVLVLSGSPSPELAFMRRVLKRDYRFSAVYRVSPRKNGVLGLQPGILQGKALVILHRFYRKHYNRDFIEALASYVRRGGALLSLGNGADQAEEYMKSPLKDLMPFSLEKRGSDPFSARRTVDIGKAYVCHPLLRVLSHPQANLLAWRNLAPILPGARIRVSKNSSFGLAYFQGIPGNTPLLIFRVLGSGLVLYINTEEAWKWRLASALASSKVDVYTGLLRNILGWAADEKRGRGLRLVTSRRRYYVGESVTVLLEDYTNTLNPDTVATLRVTDPAGGISRTVAMRKVSGGWRAEFDVKRPGVLRLTFTSPDGKDIEARLAVVRRGEEFTNPRADPRTLSEIAALSGGSFFGPGRDPCSVSIDDRPFYSRVRNSIFWLDEWWALFLLLLVLCAEWTARRVKMRI